MDAFVTKDYRELLARDDVDVIFVTSPDFLTEFAGYCKRGAPMVRFLAAAVGVPF